MDVPLDGVAAKPPSAHSASYSSPPSRSWYTTSLGPKHSTGSGGLSIDGGRFRHRDGQGSFRRPQMRNLFVARSLLTAQPLKFENCWLPQQDRKGLDLPQALSVSALAKFALKRVVTKRVVHGEVTDATLGFGRSRLRAGRLSAAGSVVAKPRRFGQLRTAQNSCSRNHWLMKPSRPESGWFRMGCPT
jgi:hypothetical protein